MKVVCFLAMLFTIAFSSSVLRAQGTIIPQTMAYQGYVNSADTGGLNGTIDLTLSLYDDDTATSNAHKVWSEDFFDVNVIQGYYSVVMDFTQAGGGWTNGNAGFTKQYWLDAIVLGNSLKPRVQLTASPYSFRAQIADSSRAAHISDTALNVVSGDPVGTIIAYGGDPTYLDPGWMICNGDSISKSEFPLYDLRCGSIYGRSGNSVYLPDLRGMFLRGVNAGRGDALADPDIAARLAPTHGALALDLVGSIETDAVGPHHHVMRVDYGNPDGQAGSGWVVNTRGAGRWDTQAGDVSACSNPFPLNNTSDTRPKNAYVYWIIKVK